MTEKQCLWETLSHRSRGWCPKVCRPVFSLCALGALFFFLAFLGQESPAPVQVMPIPQGGRVLSLEDWNALCLFAYVGEQPESGVVLALDAATGRLLSQYGFSQGELLWMGQKGNSVFAVEEREGYAYLTELSLPNLDMISNRPLSVAANNLALFDCDGEGRFYFTTKDSPNTLQVSQPNGGQETVQIEGLSNISFLEITPEGGFLGFSSPYCFWGSSADPLTWKRIDALYSPFTLLRDNYFIANPFGFLFHYGENGLLQVGSISPMPSTPLLCAMDRESHLLFLSSENTVSCITLSGESVGVVDLEGTPLALCGSGAITQKEGYYWFTSFPFVDLPDPPSPSPSEEPTPSPTPSPQVSPSVEPSSSPQASPSAGPSPSLSPSPSPMPEGIVQEGNFLVMSHQVTLQQLLSYFAPDAVEVLRPDGTAVTSGNLATGMTVGNYTIVVLGDCDGSGTLSQQDLRQCQQFLFEVPQEDNPYHRAGDLDGDGLLTTLDLVLFSQELAP